MPAATGVVQEAGVPARPSISTRQSRQEPKLSSMSVAQSLGISVPISIAARMIEVPAGTVTGSPSMVSVTVSSAAEAGVPKSISRISVIATPLRLGRAPARAAEVLGEVRERAHHRIWGEAAERTERAELHRVAEVLDQRPHRLPVARRR